MKNVKWIIGFSVFGFLLSFVSGLVSRSAPFGLILLHAVIFAAVFALLAAGLQFIFEKVLDIDYQPEPAASSVSSGSGPQKHSVDFYIEDEELPSDDNEAHFFVGNNRQMLTEADINGTAEESSVAAPASGSPPPAAAELSSGEKEDAPVSADVSPRDAAADDIAAQNKSSAGFVPVSLGETPRSISGTEAKSVEEIKSGGRQDDASDAAADPQTVQDGEDVLGVLPDLEQLADGGGAASVSESSAADDEDGFIPSGQGKSADEIAEGQDAAVMAKAISTLLAKDN